MKQVLESLRYHGEVMSNPPYRLRYRRKFWDSLSPRFIRSKQERVWIDNAYQAAYARYLKEQD